MTGSRNWKNPSSDTTRKCGYVLSGTKLFVHNADVAGKLIVVAKTGDDKAGLFLVDSDAPGVSISKLPTIALDNTSAAVFDNVAVDADAMTGDPGCAAEVLGKMNALAAVAKSEV